MRIAGLINRILCAVSASVLIAGCTVKYSFSGASISPEAKTVSIQQFENVSTMVVPILATQLTEGLQDKFSRGTRLMQVREDGDLAFEGEITNYVSNPISVSGNEYATQNRLTVTVRVRFTNRIEPQYDFDRTFSAYEDYDAMKLMQEVESTLLPEIVEKLSEDIFNAAVSNW
ncbi:MAG: LptE family protein [Rikenellaceae bacterium]|nr:LptE family protein [Rikenellaceae bacterium]